MDAHTQTDEYDEYEEEVHLPDHPPEWPKNDPVPLGGEPLPPEQWTPAEENAS